MGASLPELCDEPPVSTPQVGAARPVAAATEAADAAKATLARPVALKDSPAVSRPVLPAVDIATLRLTQIFCDLRFAQRATQAGIELSAVDVYETAQALPRTYRAADPAVLTMTFCTRANSPERAQASIEIDLEQYPALRIALGPARAESADPQGAVVPPRQPALTLAVAALLIEPLFVQLGKLHFDDLRLAGIERGRIAQTCRGPFVHLAFSFADHAVSEAPRMRYEHLIALPDAAIQCLEPIVKHAVNPSTARLTFGELPAPGRIVLGIKPLPLDTLGRLQPGDVLLRALFPSFDTHLLAPRDEAGVPGGTSATPRAVAAWGTPGLVRLCAAVKFDGTLPVIIKEPYMSDHLDSAFADAGMSIDRADDLIRVGELELPVQFEIDTLAMPLSQLSMLGPGYVIEFPVPFNDARLRLVAHGTTIGYGELVTVGEHLGVRIVRMAHTNGAPPRMDDGSI